MATERISNNFDIDGSLVVITGGNSGIGRKTAQKLALKGALVLLACRNMDKAVSAKVDIETHTGNPVKILELDLASFDSIHLFVEKLLDIYGIPDVLINNAGIFCRKYEETQIGLEMTTAVNYFAPFILTNLLFPHMKSIKAETRIVNVTSEAYRSGSFEPNYMGTKKYQYFNAYAASKRALMYYTFELAERLKETEVTVNCVNPGHAKTGIWPSDVWYWRIANKFIALKADPVGYAADNVVYAASSPDLFKMSGRYISNMLPTTVRKNVFNVNTQKMLWEYTLELVGKYE